MKEHVYKYRNLVVLRKSILIWISVAFQIILSVYSFTSEHRFIGLVMTNLVFSLLNIPGLIIHFNYRKYSIDSQLIMRYNTITLKNGKRDVTLNTFDVVKVRVHTSPYNSWLSWFDYNWFELQDKNGEVIRVNFYLISISDFWRDTLSKRISSDNVERKTSILPLMK